MEAGSPGREGGRFLKRVITAGATAVAGVGVVLSAAACQPSASGHPSPNVSFSSAPASAPYVQRLASAGYKVQKAGTLASVAPAAANLSRYFSGAALGTKAGHAELVLEVSPKASGGVKLVVSLISKRAAAKGISLAQSGDLVIIDAPEPAQITKVLT